MYPFIGKIGPVSIYSFGVMMAVAVVICTLLSSRDAKRAGLDPELIFDFVFWVVLSGILGARIFFAFLNFDYFLAQPFELFNVRAGGISWQGGLIGGTAAALLFIKKKSLPLGKFVDLIIPYAALGQSIGRIGCYLNGCCYGREVSWGLFFPVHDAHLHPTQLYSSVGLLAIFFILKKYQKVSQVPGEVLALYLILASAQRFVVEFFRADHSMLVFGLSIFQIVSLIIFACGLALRVKLKKHSQ